MVLQPPRRDPHFALVWHSRALRVRNSRRAAAASQRRVLVAANRLAEASLSKATPRLSRKFEGHAESHQRVRFRDPRTFLGSLERVSVSPQLLILSSRKHLARPLLMARPNALRSLPILKGSPPPGCRADPVKSLSRQGPIWALLRRASLKRVCFRDSRTLLGSLERVSVSPQLSILSTQKNLPHPLLMARPNALR
jgi:hypothetical protein